MSTAPADTILLYADIVGYTRLLRADREDALAKLEQFQTTMRGQVKEYGGRVLQAQRDSCLAGFERAADAVHCAEALQQTFQGEASIPVRMGLHAGAVVEKDGYAFGEGVLAVTQLERFGGAGSVVLSQAVRDQLGNEGEWATEALGSVQLDKLDHPFELYALAGKGLTIPDRPQPEEEPASDRRRWSHALKLFAGYLVAAWTVLQFIDWLLIRYQISPYWTDILLWTFVGIIPSLLIYLVHQDRMHELRLLRREKIIIPLNILLVFGVLGVAYGGVELGSIAKPFSFTDAEGNTVTGTVIKPEFVQEIIVFPFKQEEGEDSTAWIGLALLLATGVDLGQDKYLIIRQSALMEDHAKINVAQEAAGAYYVDGSYRVMEGGFEITPTLRDKRNGEVVSKRTFQGGDFFTLVDSISIYLRREIGITPAQMKQSIDLEIKNYLTDDFAAMKWTVLGVVNGQNVNLERALELDSTFALTSLVYARRLHNGPRGQLEAKYYVGLAMRHRKKLYTSAQISIMLTHYQIWGEWDKAEKLIELQLEIEPNNAAIIQNASRFYGLTGQAEKLDKLLQRYAEKFPSSASKNWLLLSGLRMGEFQRVEKEIDKRLRASPPNFGTTSILAMAYINQQKYAEAKEMIEQMIILNPESERGLAHLLDAIEYMKANPDYTNGLQRYAGIFREQHTEGISEFEASHRGIFTRTDNTEGIYLFPTAEKNFAGPGCYFADFLENDAGEVYGILQKYCSGDDRVHYHWKQGSLIWEAEESLRARDYAAASAAYETSITRHPEHYYLYDAQAHLDYRASKTEAEIQKLYQRYVGDYEGSRIRIENGELLYKRPGMPRRVLRPISDTEFMTLSRYVNRYAFDVEQGKVKGIYYYEYDNEAREWQRDEELYFARTQLAN